MNPTLESLIHLQQAENDLRRVEAELAAIPKAKSALEGRMAEERSRLDASRAALEACQKSRKAHETAVQDLEVKRSRYKGQLMEVKTNKEYTAMLHEIEGVEREIRSREDLILAEMERVEGLAAEVKREETVYHGVAEQGRTETHAFDTQSARLQEEVKRLLTERDRLAVVVPDEALDLYRRVAKLRGVAVAPAVEGMCTLCHVKLRLQFWVDLKKNEQVVQCPNCSRVVYFEAAVPVGSPPP